MIENLVVFALGALVATFLALLVIPVIWRRAARLIEQRIRTTTPLSMAEIKADKDLDRADYAVQLRKVEVRYDEVKTLAAERQIELGLCDSLAKVVVGAVCHWCSSMGCVLFVQVGGFAQLADAKLPVVVCGRRSGLDEIDKVGMCRF